MTAAGPTPSERAVAARMVSDAIGVVAADARATHRQGRRLVAAAIGARPASLVADVLRQMLQADHATAQRRGWGPEDLAEVTRRRLTPAHVALLDRSGASAAPDAAGVAMQLGLCVLLRTLPPLPALSSAGGQGATGTAGVGSDARHLTRVRALLAKAESTGFTEEAEALSAKAQELMTRHALTQLVEADAAGRSRHGVIARRLWIDAPYVLPKAMLVDAVARANRSRAVVSEHLGFSTIIGLASDLDAVDLLVTSLLVQADTAMFRHGPHVDVAGRSRTASFRRAFLVAYAARIGERLRSAAATAEAQSGHGGALVPVLRRHEQQVTDTCAAIFPRLEQRGTVVTNRRGWAAGRAAADLAALDTRRSVGRVQ